MPFPALAFHAQALRLLRVEPVVSAAAVRAIERWEASHHFRLPDAVREWYSLRDADTLLTGEFGGLLTRKELLAGFAASLSEKEQRQARVYHWRGPYEVGVVLDGSADPMTHSPTHNDIHPSQPFSHYVQFLAWDQMVSGRERYRIHVSGGLSGGKPLLAGPPHLDWMMENFELLAPQRTDDGHQFLFFSDAGRVMLTTEGDPTTGERTAHWLITADTPDAVGDLFLSVWPCHTGRIDLYGLRDANSRRRVRDRIRRKVPNAKFG